MYILSATIEHHGQPVDALPWESFSTVGDAVAFLAGTFHRVGVTTNDGALAVLASAAMPFTAVLPLSPGYRLVAECDEL